MATQDVSDDRRSIAEGHGGSSNKISGRPRDAQGASLPTRNLDDGPIRIAYLIDTFACDTEGTQKQLLETVRRLDPTRFAPHLVCLYESEWMRTHPFPCAHTTFRYDGFLKASFPRIVRQLVQFLTVHRFDILQTFFEDATIVGCLAGRLARPRPILLSTRRDTGLGSTNRPWYHACFRAVRPILNRGFDGFLTNSNEIRRILIHDESVPPGRITVQPNGVTTDTNRRDPPGLFVETHAALWIAMVASLTPVKRHDLLLKSLSIIHHTLLENDVHVVLLGDGPMRQEIETMTRSYGLDGLVHFEGAVTEVSSYLGQVDIGVLCSDREGLPNAILEYMAHGLPVAVSDAAGNLELVDHTNGISFARGNPTALASALTRLIQDARLRATMGLASSSYVRDRYRWEAVIFNLERYYQDLVKGANP